MIRVQLEDSSEVLVSKYPITNREYLIFLIWNINVFSANPNVYWKLIPGFKKENLPSDFFDNPDYFGSNFFETIKKCSLPIYSKYFLNPIYLDYPVIGINYYQATIFNKWLQDRFNEFVLSKQNINKCYEKIPQFGSDNFVTESYLCGMYKFRCGSSQLNCNTMERYPYLFPLFRLPTNYELNISKNEIDNLKTETPKKKFDVIKAYEDIFDFKVTDSSFTFKFYDKIYEIKIVTEPYKGLDSLQLEEMTLDKYANIHTSNVLDIYKSLGYSLKFDSAYVDTINCFWNSKSNTVKDTLYIGWEGVDSLGKMPFIIVGNDKKGRPLCIESYVKSYVESKNIYIYFRFTLEDDKKKYK